MSCNNCNNHCDNCGCDESEYISNKIIINSVLGTGSKLGENIKLGVNAKGEDVKVGECLVTCSDLSVAIGTLESKLSMADSIVLNTAKLYTDSKIGSGSSDYYVVDARGVNVAAGGKVITPADLTEATNSVLSQSKAYTDSKATGGGNTYSLNSLAGTVIPNGGEVVTELDLVDYATKGYVDAKVGSGSGTPYLLKNTAGVDLQSGSKVLTESDIVNHATIGYVDSKLGSGYSLKDLNGVSIPNGGEVVTEADLNNALSGINQNQGLKALRVAKGSEQKFFSIPQFSDSNKAGNVLVRTVSQAIPVGAIGVFGIDNRLSTFLGTYYIEPETMVDENMGGFDRYTKLKVYSNYISTGFSPIQTVASYSNTNSQNVISYSQPYLFYPFTKIENGMGYLDIYSSMPNNDSFTSQAKDFLIAYEEV